MTEQDSTPVFLAPSASITGEVTLGQDCSIWHNTTLRGDIAPIHVGARSNIQDGSVLHVADDLPCLVGDDVTIGHGAIIHGCKVGDRCLIGMGAIILNGAVIGEESIIGAGSLVTEGKQIPPRSLAYGNPAKVVRSLGDADVDAILNSARNYVELGRRSGERGGQQSRDEGTSRESD